MLEGVWERWEVEVLCVEKELWVWVVALVEEMAAVDVFGGRVCSIVVCRMVLTGPDTETEETV